MMACAIAASMGAMSLVAGGDHGVAVARSAVAWLFVRPGGRGCGAGSFGNGGGLGSVQASMEDTSISWFGRMLSILSSCQRHSGPSCDASGLEP